MQCAVDETLVSGVVVVGDLHVVVVIVVAVVVTVVAVVAVVAVVVLLLCLQVVICHHRW